MSFMSLAIYRWALFTLKTKQTFLKLHKGPVDQDVVHKNLVVENPKPQDILRESGQYYQDTKSRRFDGDVLGYCTPVSSRRGTAFACTEVYHCAAAYVSCII